MKFLCVACDEPMKLIEARPPDRGSLTVLFRCPTCESEVAMLTNPYETQVVGSLGVEVGAEGSETGEASKCPFSGVVRDAGLVDPGSEFQWTSEAVSRLENIPEFARPMAKTGIEKFAKERGLDEINAEVLEEAKGFFQM